MNIALEYIKYRLKAKGRHGIHSPFIYEMVDQCFKIPFETNDEFQLQSLVKSLKKDDRSIQVKDFGAGSHKLGSTRKVKDILATSSSKGRFGKLFYQFAKYYQPATVLEFGTSLGIGSIHFSLGNPAMKITTIEACSATFNLAQENFKQLNLSNITAINSTFLKYIKTEPTTKFDIIFIDGHHDGKALMNYCQLLQKNMHDTTMIIVDDIRWSDSMFAAWNELMQSTNYNVSIDLFRMGILFPRKSQVKEHFILK